MIKHHGIVLIQKIDLLTNSNSSTTATAAVNQVNAVSIFPFKVFAKILDFNEGMPTKCHKRRQKKLIHLMGKQ